MTGLISATIAAEDLPGGFGLASRGGAIRGSVRVGWARHSLDRRSRIPTRCSVPAQSDGVRLSIVIPVLNAVDTIGAQLDALVAQLSSASAEIVVVDNGSTDDTLREVADYAAHVPALRVVHCAERGECVARNMGIREARADRLLLCDHDDVVADD